jgi:uridine kinase
MTHVRVHVDGEEREVERGRSIGAVLADGGQADLVAAILNHHVVDLTTPVDADARISGVAPDNPISFPILRRTAGHMLLVAASRVAPGMTLSVGQSMFGGHYYEPGGLPDDLDLDALCASLNDELARISSEQTLFSRRQVPVELAPTVLTDHDGSKARLLRTWARPLVPVVELNDVVDIQHGPYAPHTGCAAGYRVIPYAPGIILQHGGARSPADEQDGRGLYDVYRETRGWNRAVGVENIGDLNAAALEGRSDEVVRVAEALHEKKIAEIADAICARLDDVRFVCVAGPSSAGKTTFVQRLGVQLRVNGVEPVVVGLDDYYRNREDYPRDEHGELDFEALEALDLPLIQEHLGTLLSGGEVAVPRFDFPSGKRKPASDAHAISLRKDQVLVVEGIHGLNPTLTGDVPRKAIFRIYINALSQLVVDQHNRIFTADTRLLRRIVRDRRYRGTHAADTIDRWPSVRRGEERHIFPFQREADATFNSALVYEAAVLRTFAWRYLLEVERDRAARVHAYRLLRFLELFVPVFPDGVPAGSVLREFMGGSGFAY